MCIGRRMDWRNKEEWKKVGRSAEVSSPCDVDTAFNMNIEKYRQLVHKYMWGTYDLNDLWETQEGFQIPLSSVSTWLLTPIIFTTGKISIMRRCSGLRGEPLDTNCCKPTKTTSRKSSIALTNSWTIKTVTPFPPSKHWDSRHHNTTAQQVSYTVQYCSEINSVK